MVNFDIVSLAGLDTLYVCAGELRTLRFWGDELVSTILCVV